MQSEQPTTHPSQWPGALQAMKESADMREAILGRLLFAGWQQRLAGWYLVQSETLPHWRAHWANGQRCAFRDMTAARLALASLDG